MRILVTNDDGIHSPGLTVAETIAKSLSDDVWIVAPENEQSGASHSLTLASPLRLRKIAEKCFAVSGTPTDCVMMAALQILKNQPPDLVLSGVNWGSNLADDVTYSGTIAGAMEGCALGIRSIAMSQAYDEEGRDKIDWSPGELHGPALIRRLLEAGWPDGTLININFPGCPAAESYSEGMAAVKLSAQGGWGYMDADGRPAIPPSFSKAYPFQEGRARVLVGTYPHGKHGFIDKRGNMVIPPRWHEAEDFQQGLARVRLQRRESEISLRIVIDDEIDRPIAEIADTVEQQNTVIRR